jgi:hypothetical protein
MANIITSALAGCTPELRMNVQEEFRLFKTRPAGKTGVLLFLALTATLPAAAGTITYEAYAGSVGGNGEAGSGLIIGNGGSGSGSNCTTYGPTSITTSEGVYADGGYTAFSSAAPVPASIIPCALGIPGAVRLRRRGLDLKPVEEPKVGRRIHA